MSQYRMLSDSFLSRFKNFMDAERGPQGAFDSALKVRPKKEPVVPYRFVPVPHCGGTLFLRERSNDLAFDEATEISDPAKRILAFLREKLSDSDMAQVEDYLKAEAGVKTDAVKEADAMRDGAIERRGGASDARRRAMAQDAHANASTAAMADFAERFPGAARIGQV